MKRSLGKKKKAIWYAEPAVEELIFFESELAAEPSPLSPPDDKVGLAVEEHSEDWEKLGIDGDNFVIFQ